MSLALETNKPEPGDLIEIFRGSYQHWAVYVGDGFIVHLAPPSEVAEAGINSMMSVLSDKALVKKEELWDVVGNNKWRVNNGLDQKYVPRPARVIVEEADAFVGQSLPYCVIRGNCEHFVNELRYGKAESRQVCKAGELALLTGLAAAVGVGVVALAAAFFGSSKKQDKNKQ
ncbi:phospholipase A and acyltransferase 3-like [Neosynchiropus ocellatus]